MTKGPCEKEHVHVYYGTDTYIYKCKRFMYMVYTPRYIYIHHQKSSYNIDHNIQTLNPRDVL